MRDFFDLIKQGRPLNSIAPVLYRDPLATSRLTFGIRMSLQRVVETVCTEALE